MAIRTSPLAEIKVLSLAALLYTKKASGTITGGEIDEAAVFEAIDDLRTHLKDGSKPLQANKDIFKTVGIARQVRVDEDYGTQAIYGIGSPTRPRMVPNNFSVNVTVDRLQLDRRNAYHYLSTPEFWYSDEVQKNIGIDDALLYSYFFLRSKEDSTSTRYDIYALMPRSSSFAVSSGDVLVVHNVSLTGYKYTYEEMFFDASNMVNEYLTNNVPLPTGGSGGSGGSIGSGLSARISQD